MIPGKITTHDEFDAIVAASILDLRDTGVVPWADRAALYRRARDYFLREDNPLLHSWLGYVFTWKPPSALKGAQVARRYQEVSDESQEIALSIGVMPAFRSSAFDRGPEYFCYPQEEIGAAGAESVARVLTKQLGIFERLAAWETSEVTVVLPELPRLDEEAEIPAEWLANVNRRRLEEERSMMIKPEATSAGTLNGFEL
jgi:hypothetical protein